MIASSKGLQALFTARVVVDDVQNSTSGFVPVVRHRIDASL